MAKIKVKRVRGNLFRSLDPGDDFETRLVMVEPGTDSQCEACGEVLEGSAWRDEGTFGCTICNSCFCIAYEIVNEGV